ncbi:MAG: hypothetical protein C5B53_12030 [Candidatus Melainabacteria bacterium]|nr:MAG: hypothetical protein C5B53_12030 [Candidatus Melainabacteria bacterium]
MPSVTAPPLTRSSREQKLSSLPEVKQFNENLIIAFSFALCLFIFFAVSAAKCLSKKAVLNENREPAKFPEVAFTGASISSFPHGFEEYFDDRFAFRDRIIADRTLLYLKLFRVSGSSKVIIGKNKFFFYSDDVNLPMIMGSRPFTEPELRSWKELLERRQSWCQARGIDYIFVLAPTKPSIYSEFLPDEYGQRSRRTRTDQLLDFLKQTRSSVQVVDLRASLRAHKGVLPLFLLTDTHWNQLGAYYGYKAIIDALTPRHPNLVAPVPLSDLNLRPYHFVKGDLSRMQGVLGIITETNVAVDHKQPVQACLVRDSQFTENKLGFPVTGAFGYHQERKDLPSAVMFRDSFACYMIELYLPQQFSRISFFWQPDFSQSIVQREKPEIVVQEILESNLYGAPPEM